MKSLKLGVVGAGRLGGFHAQKLAAMPEVELVAIADPLEANRQRVSAACHCHGLEHPEDLLGEVDAVVIAAPTARHHELGMTFLRQGVHVLMEKPIATTAAHADELVDAARRRGVVLQVGHVERFNPAFSAAAPHVRNPKYIEAVRTSPFTFRSTDIGAVLDMMIHDLDLVLALVRAPVVKVEALGLSVLGGHEDVANVRLHFANGCLAALSASRVSYEAVRKMQVWSLGGFAAIDFAARTASVVHPSQTLQERQFHVDELSPEQVEHYKTHLFEEHLPREQMNFEAVDALKLELEDFVESIRAPRAPRVSGEQARDAVAVAGQILEQIQTHAWDGTSDGRFGPLAIPRPRVVPAPHFDREAAELAPRRRREAG